MLNLIQPLNELGERVVPKSVIEKILADHGNEVITEVLNAYNIKLSENLSYDYHSGLLYAEFLGFKIISNPKLNTHKIIKNDKL